MLGALGRCQCVGRQHHGTSHEVTGRALRRQSIDAGDMVGQLVVATAQGVGIGERATSDEPQRKQPVTLGGLFDVRNQRTDFVDPPSEQESPGEGLTGEDGFGRIGGRRGEPHPPGDSLGEIEPPDRHGGLRRERGRPDVSQHVFIAQTQDRCRRAFDGIDVGPAALQSAHSGGQGAQRREQWSPEPHIHPNARIVVCGSEVGIEDVRERPARQQQCPSRRGITTFRQLGVDTSVDLVHVATQERVLQLHRVRSARRAHDDVVFPRLQIVISPDPGHRVLADADPGCHRTGAPARRAVGWAFVLGEPQHLSDSGRRHRRLAATALGDHSDPNRTAPHEPSSPATHRVRVNRARPGDLLVPNAVSCHQQSSRLQNHTIWQHPRPRQLS